MSNPNITVIMTDQQRADACKRAGFALDTTPFLDSLAGDGVWFDNAYTSSPLCVPARISMLTGRFPSAHRIRINQDPHKAVFEKDLVELVRGRGYKTALIGKNHTYLEPGDFDFFTGYEHNGKEGGAAHQTSATHAEFDEYLERMELRVGMHATPFPLECQMPYRIVDEACDWLDSVENEPFFMWLSFPEPHNPYQVPEPYFSMFPPDSLPLLAAPPEALDAKGFKWHWLKSFGKAAIPCYDDIIPRMRSNYYGMLRLIDDQMRRFVGYLKVSGKFDNTYIVFVSDHGDFVGDYGLMKKGVEMPEVLTKIPFIFMGPSVARGDKACGTFVSITDIFPTFCEILGEKQPDGVQGRSLMPLLRSGGDAAPPARANLYTSAYTELGFGGRHYDERDGFNYTALLGKTKHGYRVYNELNVCTMSGTLRALRHGDWKLVYDMTGKAELYNLADDPMELTDLSGDARYGNVLNTMIRLLLTRVLELDDTLPMPRERFRL